MVVQVLTRDFELARSLLTRLARHFGKNRVAVRTDGEVELKLPGAGNGALTHTLETVEDWLRGTPLPSVRICVDGRAYTVDQPEPTSESEANPVELVEDSAERLRRAEEENSQLRTALNSRIVIEQAKGALSVTHGLAPEDAFHVLRTRARSRRQDIHALAAEIVRNRGHLPAVSE